MDLELEGRTVLVTGGSKGIGLGCAQAFAAEGARVAIVSRERANVDAALRTLGGGHGFTADLGDARAASDLVERVEAEVGPIDVLVNSAGAARRSPPDELTAQAYHDAMRAKYFTYVHVIDPVIKRMAERGRGVIVNVIGIGGKVPSPLHVPGGAANAALSLVTAGLATAYAGRGVRVVGVSPGVTRTERMREGAAAEARARGITVEEAEAAQAARIPLGRLAEPDDIAQAVLFLASPRASYLTGVNIAMDGAAKPVVI